jgi:hypothetical protein
MMRLRKLAKDGDSGMNGCHTVYAPEADAGSLVIQADQVDEATLAILENLLEGETAVRIKRTVVEDALRKLREEEDRVS